MKKDASIGESITLAVAFAGLIWLIKTCESFFGWELQQLGIYPKTAEGLIGILVAPLIHGSWTHAIHNTLPILILGSLLIYGYSGSRWRSLALIWLLSGIGVWLFARDSYHFGASGLTHGVFFYLLISGVLRRDKFSIVILVIAFFMHGSMLMTIFPREPNVSYEYHFFGALSGLISAILFRHSDIHLSKKTRPLDNEEDPIIGDQWMTEEQRNKTEEDQQ